MKPAAIRGMLFDLRKPEAPLAGHRDGITCYRTIFMSDLHLGTPGCQAELMLDFLRRTDADTIFLCAIR